MSSTLRERKRGLVLLAVWLLATVFCTFAGPFGTHDALTIVPRFFYWAGIIALSVFGTTLSLRLAKKADVWKALLFWVGFTLVLSGIIHGVNSWLFPGWQGVGQLLYLIGIIAMTVVVVHGTLALARTVFVPPAEISTEDTEASFLRRLPLDRRGKLIRLEAQDHYLNVVTQKGSTLVLLRLQDAVEALKDLDGLQVHRSHWVATGAVVRHRRVQGRDFLILASGEEVPVSRSYRPLVQEAGLI